MSHLGQEAANIAIPKISLYAASSFAEKWKDTQDEQQNSQAFWQDFFRDLLGIADLKAAGIEFEKKVVSSTKGTTTRIDVFWKDVFLVEQKSAGKDLNLAEKQAREYLVSLPPASRPPFIIVCDFNRMRLVDVLLNSSVEFLLEDLPNHLDRIESLTGNLRDRATRVEIEADQKAAKLMANLYIELEKFGYQGHQASVFLVRILFCLFADDTRMWRSGIFGNLMRDTNEEGTDLGPRIAQLFKLLNTPKELRRGPQDNLLEDFPYVNGGIFQEDIGLVNFNSSMRKALISACSYDWSQINPTIFGALFQNIKSKEERHENGEHYTSEAHIEKILGPLFINDLNEKLELAWDSQSKLKSLQNEIGNIQLLDPACGCGNFLITAYKRLRQIELNIIIRIKQLSGTSGQTSMFDVSTDLKVTLEQLHGIEFVEWSAQIAKVAIYLTDHQQNLELESVLGIATNRFPLVHTANIVQGNALEIDWNEVCPIKDETLILGNPPFLGSSWQSDEQRTDTKKLWAASKGSSSLDYVANWYLLAARNIKGTKAKCAFVSTNSITQGEQPAALWSELEKYEIYIDFAHQTFSWTSDSAGKAAVHCVIIGFSQGLKTKKKELFTYEIPTSAPRIKLVSNINAYLLDAPNVLVFPRSKPLVSGIQPMRYGNMPNEFGYLANIYDEDIEELKLSGDLAINYIRPIIGAAEMLQNKKRYCLWLVEASPKEMNGSKFISERIEMVRKLRSESKRKATVALSKTPYLFQEVREQKGDYLAVPIVSSETREYVPMKIFPKEVIPTNALLTIPAVELYLFSILQSKIFSLWLRTVGGKLESRFRISAEIVYNNFPFPQLSPELKISLAKSASRIISAREEHQDSSLADMYSPNTMPMDLRAAHDQNDSTVLSIFGLKKDADDQSIIEALFIEYGQLILEADSEAT